MTARKIIGRLLLAFVLVSVGYAIGRETAPTPASAPLPLAVAESPGAAGESRVVVYYLHSTFRCMTCNLIESTTEELIRTEFAEAVKAGRLEWKPVDYLQNEFLADRYNVSGNLIVVARFKDGREAAARRLERVMELVHDREAFLRYVRQAIEESLKEAA